MPPFVGVAVNVTDVPEHIDVAEAAINTDGTRTGLTVAITAVLVPVVQPTAVAST